ncbi:MAG: hypothetical protein KDE27_07720 [Planctomycetes bacterium]|nr:hypothetical protein [Planctomycetota bacterium]
MRGFWDFLLANPILFFVIAAWIAGGIGNVIRSQKNAQRRAERRASTTPSRPATPVRRVEPPEPPPRPQPRPQAQRRGPDDIAAEMRRILGLDGPPAQPEPPPVPRRASEVMPRSEPIRREVHREVVEAEPPPVPLAPEVARRMLERRIGSHVGENISHRRGPRSGRVGKHDREWGALGGRRRRESTVAVTRGGIERLVDLDDIKRVILGAEILGPPLALREPGRERMI